MVILDQGARQKKEGSKRARGKSAPVVCHYGSAADIFNLILPIFGANELDSSDLNLE